MRPIHIEIRYLAVQHFIKYKSWELTCSIFRLSRSSLQRFTRKYMCGDQLDPKKKYQPRKFSDHHKDYVLSLIRRHVPVMRMCQSFERHFQMKISPRTIRRWLKGAHVTYRKVVVRPKLPRSRRTFYNKIKGIPIDRILSVDEAGLRP
jgi:transposase